MEYDDAADAIFVLQNAYVCIMYYLLCVIHSPPIIIQRFVPISFHSFKMFVASCLKKARVGSANTWIHASERMGSLK